MCIEDLDVAEHLSNGVRMHTISGCMWQLPSTSCCLAHIKGVAPLKFAPFHLNHELCNAAGQVCLAMLDGRPVAAKFIGLAEGPLTNANVPARLLRELSILKDLDDSPCLVRFLGVTRIGKRLVIVTELMEETLYEALGRDRFLWGPRHAPLWCE